MSACVKPALALACPERFAECFARWLVQQSDEKSWKGVWLWICFMHGVLPENIFLRASTTDWNALRDLFWERGDSLFSQSCYQGTVLHDLTLESTPSSVLVSPYLVDAAVKQWQLLFSFRPQEKNRWNWGEHLINLWVLPQPNQKRACSLLWRWRSAFQMFYRSHFYTTPPI